MQIQDPRKVLARRSTSIRKNPPNLFLSLISRPKEHSLSLFLFLFRSSHPLLPCPLLLPSPAAVYLADNFSQFAVKIASRNPLSGQSGAVSLPCGSILDYPRKASTHVSSRRIADRIVNLRRPIICRGSAEYYNNNNYYYCSHHRDDDIQARLFKRQKKLGPRPPPDIIALPPVLSRVSSSATSSSSARFF